MAKAKKVIPFSFVIDNLYSLQPFVRPMFGAYAVYVGNKIVFILRDKDDTDSGVWIATVPEHHDSLKKDFPPMRSIELFGGKVSSWQVIHKDDIHFETLINNACDMVLKGDIRIGKIPVPKKKKKK